MHTIKKLACWLLCLLPLLGIAQTNHATLNIQVFDAQTQESVKNVKVYSRFLLNKDKKIHTDFLGRTNLIPIVGDTITFDHPDYYHLHIILHDHNAHDFGHPFKVYLTGLNPKHEKSHKQDFTNTEITLHHFEPLQAHHTPLKIGVIEDERASQHRKSWIEKTRNNNKDFNLIDVHLRTKKQ